VTIYLVFIDLKTAIVVSVYSCNAIGSRLCLQHQVFLRVSHIKATLSKIVYLKIMFPKWFQWFIKS